MKGNIVGYRYFETLKDPYWEKQPDESPTAYERFKFYRDEAFEDDTVRSKPDLQHRAQRSLRLVADEFRVADRTIRELAKCHRWKDRIAALDDELSRQHRERMAARAERFADQQLATANELLYASRAALQHLIHNDGYKGMEPDEVAKWIDASIKLGKAALEPVENPRSVLRAATSRGDSNAASMVELEIPELAELSPQGQRERITDALSSLVRLQSYLERPAVEAPTRT